MQKFVVDLAERVGATAAEAGLGVLITDLSGVPVWWAVLLVPVLSAAKGLLASFIGDPNSAGLLPRTRRRTGPSV